MITCTCNGRLGNHLFQIANLINVSKILNTNFIVPSYAADGHRGMSPVDLSGFSYNFSRTSTETPTQILHGFCQSYQSFENIKDELTDKYFSFNEDVLNKASKYQIPSESLGISIRRGDYLMLQQQFNCIVLSLDYYQSAISKYFPEVERIYIFTDDFPWCQNVFGQDCIYVDEDKFVQLYLMTRMKHLILSNSTFAWWGAYLNQNNGTIVIPDPWSSPKIKSVDTSGLYYPTWKRQTHEIKFQV